MSRIVLDKSPSCVGDVMDIKLTVFLQTNVPYVADECKDEKGRTWRNNNNCWYLFREYFSDSDHDVQGELGDKRDCVVLTGQSAFVYLDNIQAVEQEAEERWNKRQHNE